MRAHYLQHVPFEGLGSMAPWLAEHGYEITESRLFESSALPAPDELDLLIIMGGPMSVNDEAEYPWLKAEKRFVRQAIEAGLPVLGVCLGAQLIATAMGGRVYANPVKEIGWFPIQSVATQEAAFQFDDSVEVFHWHGETFELPPRAVHLARSEACEHQAFQLGRQVVGLQFHLETTPATARALVENCRDELVAGPYVQDEATILAAEESRYAAINQLMAELLAYLVRTTQ